MNNGNVVLRFRDGANEKAEELNRQFNQLRSQSGLLRLSGKIEKCGFEDLKEMEELGNGSCGRVSKMECKGHVMAVKVQRAHTGNPEVTKRILMDLDVVIRCNSPFIVNCFGFFIEESMVFICMEVMATCLDRFLTRIQHKPVPEKYIGKMAVSIISALNYLKEEMKIMHRDVKPSNILMDWDGNVKMCDFGISGKLIESKVFTRNAGCYPYMAPERFHIFPDENGIAPYDVRADVWSVGITLVELATGRYPYPGESEMEILAALQMLPSPSLSPDDGFSAEFCDFVRLCLTKEVEKRPKYDVLMEHPFYKNNQNSKVNMREWFQDHMTCEE